ncbi:hypothetical protein AWC15_17980 [Mycobacterium lacus]|uniref:Uncharacterized protein n=1 Tax=Mycobacterium lacus TaxID=169765 RepID=A0A1X1YE68_9MYCO|nr:hypothetical protein [Mycobacterium lacus]ORW09325.1 hypothetical protein AWC15_17980 [Mycobacterium lacus]BBX96782.1 hypothetical protein MLAC_20760 [Mycobacterium lacus]
MFPFADDRDHPAHPLSDEQTRAQVIDPAKQIAKVAGLPDVSGVFGWESCNDQGDPPFRGRVDMSFDVPAGVDHDTYFEQIAKTMVTHGWSAGPPTGKHLFGTVIHKDGVMAIIGKSGGMYKDGSVDLFGECRNMGEHRHDGKWYDVTDQLQAG